MDPLISHLLESRWGVLIMALLLLLAQVLVIGSVAWVWLSYPIGPVQFTADHAVWGGIVLLAFSVDALFVLLCDWALLQRRANLVKKGVEEETESLARQLRQAAGYEKCLRLANQRLANANLDPVLLNGSTNLPDLAGLAPEERAQVLK